MIAASGEIHAESIDPSADGVESKSRHGELTVPAVTRHCHAPRSR
jgi:hypothetical protein